MKSLFWEKEKTLKCEKVSKWSIDLMAKFLHLVKANFQSLWLQLNYELLVKPNKQKEAGERLIKNVFYLSSKLGQSSERKKCNQTNFSSFLYFDADFLFLCFLSTWVSIFIDSRSMFHAYNYQLAWQKSFLVLNKPSQGRDVSSFSFINWTCGKYCERLQHKENLFKVERERDVHYGKLKSFLQLLNCKLSVMLIQ